MTLVKMLPGYPFSASLGNRKKTIIEPPRKNLSLITFHHNGWFITSYPWKSKTILKYFKIWRFLLEDDKLLLFHNGETRKPTYQKWWPRTSRVLWTFLVEPPEIKPNQVLAEVIYSRVLTLTWTGSVGHIRSSHPK